MDHKRFPHAHGGTADEIEMSSPPASRYDRRRADRPSDDEHRSSRRDRAKAFISQAVTLKELALTLVSTMMAIGGALVAMGWRAPESPGARIASVEAEMRRQDSSARQEIHQLRAYVDSLSYSVRFLTYLQCEGMRRDDPAAVPDGCLPIMQSFRGR